MSHKTTKHLDLSRWIKEKSHPAQRTYRLFSKDFPLTAIINKETKIIFMIIDTDKKETVYNPYKGIDEGKKYECCF